MRARILRTMPAFRTIAVAVDGSAPAERALSSAIELAKLASASLTVVGVVPTPVVYSDAGGMIMQVLAENRRSFAELIDHAATTARAAGVARVTTSVLEGVIIDSLLGFLDETKPDLLVMGARGLSTTGRLFLGSVSDGVLHHAQCSVLIVRPSAPPPTRTKSALRRSGRRPATGQT
jgi:nucleotide-binding universal stress UspA family protein